MNLRLIKKIEVDHEFSAKEIGAQLASSDAKVQADIFNAMAKGFCEFKSGQYGKEFQVLSIIDDLTPEAKDWFCLMDMFLDLSDNSRRDRKETASQLSK